MTNRQKTILEIVGAISVVAAAIIYNPILGLFVFGVLCILAAEFGGTDAGLG